MKSAQDVMDHTDTWQVDCSSLNHIEITTEVGVIFRLLITLYLSQHTTDFAYSTEDL